MLYDQKGNVHNIYNKTYIRPLIVTFNRGYVSFITNDLSIWKLLFIIYV